VGRFCDDDNCMCYTQSDGSPFKTVLDKSQFFCSLHKCPYKECKLGKKANEISCSKHKVSEEHDANDE